MAKQVGPLFITGTIDGVIFYKLNGQYLMRSKGDYRSGKQMRKDPCLKRTMANADQFGVASKLVKYSYYRYLPPEVRRWGLYGELTGMVKRWLQSGKSNDEAETLLIAYMKTLLPKEVTETINPPTIVKQLPSTAKEKATEPSSGQHSVAVPNTRNRKQARYLSRWKVNKRGYLHIPKSESGLPLLIPLADYRE